MSITDSVASEIDVQTKPSQPPFLRESFSYREWQRPLSLGSRCCDANNLQEPREFQPATSANVELTVATRMR